MKKARIFICMIITAFLVTPLFAAKVMNMTDKIIVITAGGKGIGFAPGKSILLTQKEFNEKAIQDAIKNGKLKVISK